MSEDRNSPEAKEKESANRLVLHTALRSVFGPFLVLMAAVAFFLVALSLSGYIAGMRVE